MNPQYVVSWLQIAAIAASGALGMLLLLGALYLIERNRDYR